MRRYGVIGLGVLAMAVTGCVVLRTCWARMVGSIPALGGKELRIRLPDGGQTFLQKDARWAEVQLGASSGTLGSHGCLVSSVAMACTHLGTKLTPKDLNERLIKADGYLRRAGWCGVPCHVRRTNGSLPCIMTCRLTRRWMPPWRAVDIRW